MECIQAKEPDKLVSFKASQSPLELDGEEPPLEDPKVVMDRGAPDNMEEAPIIPAQMHMVKPTVGIVLLEQAIPILNMPIMAAVGAVLALQAVGQLHQSACAVEAT